MDEKEKQIALKIREMAPKITVNIYNIPWWNLKLRKYRKSRVSAIGLKDALDIIRMVKKQLGEKDGVTIFGKPVVDSETGEPITKEDMEDKEELSHPLKGLNFRG